MWQPHVFVVLFGLLSLYGKGADCQHPGYTLNAHRLVWVASGLCVEIPCTFTVPAGSTLSTRVTGIWKRKGTPDIVVASTEASMVSEGTKGRFTLTGKVQEGDCSFSISNAQPADQGEYEFRIEDGSDGYSYSQYRLSVSVTDSPSNKIKVSDLPEPTISPGGELIAGKPITLTCTAHPAPQGCKGNITWGGRIKMTKLYNYKQEDQAGKSIISFTPSQREHNSPLTCTVTYSGVSTNSSITLKVQYSPSIKIRVSGYNGTYENKSLTITEGDSVNISCYVKSRPMADISCGEGQGYNVIKAPRERVLVLQNVSVADGVTYTCLARNTHGSVSETVSVTVEYAPRSSFISNCTSEGCRVEAIEGTSLSLLCSAESNPPANLSWAKTGQNSTDPLNSSSGRLDVSHVTTDNGGDYMCRARNKHGNSTVSITVVILYAPRGLTFNYCAVNGCFVEGNSSVKVQEGNSLYLRCDADGNPVANVSWVKQMQNGTITQISLTAQLNVTNVTAEHGGNYMCQTINRIGNTSKSISVVVIKTLTKDKIHLEGFMFGGIFVLLLAAITAVLVMRYKKKRRPPEEVEGSQRSPPNNYEVVYANIKRKTREPNMDPSPPNEGESPDKDLQYVTLDFSKLKPKSSPEPQETLYTEVKRK
uniref:Sialic acid-binding Ig-like lectin like 2 n=1 Tax=Xenopus tropicalis TaxID=8364 RepID=A0A803J6C1_XENTR